MEKSLVPHKLWLIWIRMKQKKFFFLEKKNSKWPPKKSSFSSSANFNFFEKNFPGISPWFSRINWCKGCWCGSTYMNRRGAVQRKLKNSLKTQKMHFFACFWAYVGQPHNHIGWVTSMPFASINPTHPRTNPRNFHEKILRIGEALKMTFV